MSEKRKMKRDLDVIVVGAGFAGVYMVHKMRELGYSVRAFEAGDGLGGTWFWNRYPGARCDVESMEYSYGFSEELEQDWQGFGERMIEKDHTAGDLLPRHAIVVFGCDAEVGAKHFEDRK